MSLNVFLIQLVALTCVFLLVQARRLPRGWLVVASIVLAVLLGSLWLIPDRAGWISGGVWALLILVPIMGSAWVNQLVAQERYGRAHKIAQVLRWLHPADGLWEYPQLLHGLELGQRGQFDAAMQIFRQYQTSASSTGRIATALLYRLGAQWPELRSWVQTHVPDAILFKETAIAALYVRSLGETGDLNGLLQGVEQFERVASRSQLGVLNLVRLYALAFCGYPEQVRRLLEGPLAMYPASTQQFWLATAYLAAGQGAIAREQFQILSLRGDPALRKAIQWRLAHPVLHPDQQLNAGSAHILAQISTAIRQESQYSSHTAFRFKNSYITYALIGINLMVFMVEIALGGSENLLVLYQMGALLPEVVFAGEWWRSLTAIFLHAGPLHLGSNMLGLYVFGSIVETALGHRRFLLTYLWAGVGSMLVVASLGVFMHSAGQITVGASGAVMGILGAEGAIQLKGWRLEKARVARERLRLILIVVGLQFVSDLITPQVSMIGHVSGLILGFIAATLLFEVRK